MRRANDRTAGSESRTLSVKWTRDSAAGAVHHIADVEEADVQFLFHTEYFKICHQLFATRTADASTNNLHTFIFPCGSVRGLTLEVSLRRTASITLRLTFLVFSSEIRFGHRKKSEQNPNILYFLAVRLGGLTLEVLLRRTASITLRPYVFGFFKYFRTYAFSVITYILRTAGMFLTP